MTQPERAGRTPGTTDPDPPRGTLAIMIGFCVMTAVLWGVAYLTLLARG